MSPCNDPSTAYLKGLGFNVVRFPSAGITPLGLLGRQGGSTTLLGRLSQLIVRSAQPMPVVTANSPCAAINGQRTSNFKLNLGLSILSNFLGAMGGGSIGANLGFTDAESIIFSYDGVLEDSALPLDIGNYLREADIDIGNLILRQYAQGNGNLYVITKIAKSQKFTVSFSKDNGTSAAVDVPVLQGAVGANISVAISSSSKSTFSFAGAVPLAFGFQCLSVGLVDNQISLTTSRPGAVSMSKLHSEQLVPEILDSPGLIEFSAPPSAK